MKGLFSAKVRGGLIPISTRVEGAVYYRRPNSMRLRGFTPIGGTPEELAAVIKADLAKWGKVIRDAGIRAE